MKLLKTSFCVLLAILLMAAYIPVNSHAADTASLKSGVGFISADSLRLRASPSTQSATLAYASKGEVVVLCERTGSWYRVIYNLQEGYMHSNYLITTATENIELGYGKVNYSAVNMRTGPGTGYNRIAQSRLKDLCYIIGINNQKFIFEIKSVFLDYFFNFGFFTC